MYCDNPDALVLPEETDLPYNPGRIHRSDKVKCELSLEIAIEKINATRSFGTQQELE